MSKAVKDMSKEELKTFIKDVFETEMNKPKNKIFNKEDVKNIVREMLKKHYRNLWSNSGFYLDKI